MHVNGQSILWPSNSEEQPLSRHLMFVCMSIPECHGTCVPHFLGNGCPDGHFHKHDAVRRVVLLTHLSRGAVVRAWDGLWQDQAGDVGAPRWFAGDLACEDGASRGTPQMSPRFGHYAMDLGKSVGAMASTGGASQDTKPQRALPLCHLPFEPSPPLSSLFLAASCTFPETIWVDAQEILLGVFDTVCGVVD